MKRLLLLLALLVPLSLPAQTNTNTTPKLSLLGEDLSKFGGDVWKYFQDSQPYFSNRVVRPTLGVLYLPNAPKKWGGLLHFDVPVDQNGQVNVGFAAAYINDSIYDATVNVTLGTTWNSNAQIPWIGSFHTWAGTGPGYNFHTKSAVVHSETGVSKRFTIGKGELAISGMGLQISDLPGWGAGGLVTYTWRF